LEKRETILLTIHDPIKPNQAIFAKICVTSAEICEKTPIFIPSKKTDVMKKLILISFVISIAIFSCQKSDTKDYDADLKMDLLEETGEGACFEFIYPITFIMPDGTTVTGNDKEEIGQAIKSWYIANPGSKDKPTLQYPVNVIFRGELITLENASQMKRIKSACEGGEKPCFRMIYPVTFIMPDGSEITGENRKELRTAIKTWYVENPGYEERPSMQYPVEIKFKDKVLTINSDEEMKRIKKKCEEGKKRCFVFIYPISYIMPDGTVITCENKEDKIAVREWYLENPGVEEKPSFVYPFDIKFRDGKIITINSIEEFKRAKKSCD